MNVNALCVALSALTLLACEPKAPPEQEAGAESKAEEKTEEKTEEKPAEAGEGAGVKVEGARQDGPSLINPFERSKRKSIASEALLITRKVTDGARSYISSDQRITGPDRGQPWHEGGMVGMPVASEDYVFPGGVNFSFSTHEEVPRGGKKSMTTLDAEDAKIAAALEKLGLTFEPETYFRYTYTTGPGTGKDATLKIEAEADFDPGSPEVHTVTYEVTVNDDLAAVVGEQVVENELQ